VDALRELGEFDRVHELAEEGGVLAKAMGDRGLELRFEQRRLYLRIMRNPNSVLLGDIIAEAQAAAAEAAELEDPLAEGEALLRAGRLLGDIGKTTEGQRTVGRAKECFDRAGVDSPELAFVTAPSLSFQGPHTIAEDIEHGERALVSVDETSPSQAFNHLGLGVSRAMLGQFDQARQHIRRGATVLRELGMTLELAAAVGLSGGIVQLAAGDFAAAEAAVRPAYETLVAVGEMARMSSRAALLAAVLYEQGRYDDAMDLVEEADADTAADDMEPQIWLRGVRAKVLAQRGMFESAEREAVDNCRLAETTEWPAYTGMAWLDLAEVLHLAGRNEEAARAARTAEDYFDLKGALVLLERARAFREVLEAGG
jgi:tetratricopeptide (TPR) repeat protein